MATVEVSELYYNLPWYLFFVDVVVCLSARFHAASSGYGPARPESSCEHLRGPGSILHGEKAAADECQGLLATGGAVPFR